MKPTTPYPIQSSQDWSACNRMEANFEDHERAASDYYAHSFQALRLYTRRPANGANPGPFKRLTPCNSSKNIVLCLNLLVFISELHEGLPHVSNTLKS